MTDLQTIFAQRKINNRAESIEMPAAFTDKFPELSIEKANKLFCRYLEAVSGILLPRLPWLTEDETYVSTDRLINHCGEFRYKKDRYWVWNEFKDIYPLFTVLEKGSNIKKADSPFQKNTKVCIVNKRILKIMLHEKGPEKVFNELYSEADLANPQADHIEIDMENLQNYIDCTDYEVAKSKPGPLRFKLEKNLWQAMTVQKVGLHTEAETGVAFLPLIPSPSPFGRIYYKGLNVHNVTKQVRAALIGPHYQYDMTAAVYGIKLALFNGINGGENNLVGTPKGTYTREYLTNKDAIRKRLANFCYQGVPIPDEAKIKNIKLALTAIGFGAKTTSGFWLDEDDLRGSALTQIMKSPDARERFLNDPWVKHFLCEQHDMEEAILEDIRAGDGYAEICEVVKKANGANGRISKALVLAYIYQHCETSVMNVALDILDRHNIRVKARIHDAFVTMQPVPDKVMDEIYVAWSAYSSHLALEREEVRGWIAVDFKKALDEQKAMMADHKAFIRREEYKAASVGGAA